MSDLKKVYFHSLPSDTYQLYQHYYLQGLIKNGIEVEFVGGQKKNFAQKVLRRIQRQSANVFRGETEHVGQYLFEFSDQQTLKVAIDAHDHHYVWSPDICAWSDIYFKCNYRSGFDYPQKVFQLVNGNGFLTDHNFEYLRQLRNSPKRYDLCFISRIWGGVEHNLRMFEALSQVDCKKKLLAVFPEDWKMDDKQVLVERLESCGVEWTDQLIDKEELWTYCGQSRYNILRAGKYMCTPWRLIDLMAMGSAIVLDNAPLTEWPEKLVEQKNFYSLDLQRSDTSAIDLNAYLSISVKIQELLSEDTSYTDAMSQTNATYFDQHVDQVTVIGHLLAQLPQCKKNNWGSM